MFNIKKYHEIQGLIEKNGRNTEIIAISKNHPKESVIQAIKEGVYTFGENRVFEAKSKFVDLKDIYPKIKLHLTGPLQSNKVKEAASLFDVFHTLDREKIAKEFSKNINLINNKEIYIQVNTGDEDTKSGIHIKDLKDFFHFCKVEMKLNIVGLMCIPPITDDPKYHFNMLQQLCKAVNLSELSIGMSNDFIEALEFNPKYIRIGTALFGSRS